MPPSSDVHILTAKEICSSRLHVKLMKHQQEELMSLKSWLSSTEERIAAMSPVGSSLTEVKQQLEQHRQLQRDLENEQSTVSSLSNMVVVVDDPASDAAYAQLEDELTALGWLLMSVLDILSRNA
jgi:dystrophin